MCKRKCLNYCQRSTRETIRNCKYSHDFQQNTAPTFDDPSTQPPRPLEGLFGTFFDHMENPLAVAEKLLRNS